MQKRHRWGKGLLFLAEANSYGSLENRPGFQAVFSDRISGWFSSCDSYGAGKWKRANSGKYSKICLRAIGNIKLFNNNVYWSSAYWDNCLETPPHPSFDMMICYCSTWNLGFSSPEKSWEKRDNFPVFEAAGKWFPDFQPHKSRFLKMPAGKWSDFPDFRSHKRWPNVELSPVQKYHSCYSSQVPN